MIINDAIYGQIKIENPLIQELINTKAFQRLKNINQYGGVNFVFPEKFQNSRFDHSIGVWHVLNQAGANIEVQVAGLLHDIGHTAFSHMIDQAMKNENEDYHEKFFDRIKGIDEVFEILNRNNIKLEPVDNYPEIKKSLPDVGADRIDYAIRDYFASTGKDLDMGQKVIEHIKLVGRDFVFSNIEIATKYALNGLDAMWLVIYEPSVVGVYQSIIGALQEGMEKGWLQDSDLIESDAHVLKLIKTNASARFSKVFTHKYKVTESTKDDYDIHHTKLKLRYFDPFVLIDNKKIQLSEIDAEFKAKLKDKIQEFEMYKSGGYFKIHFF